MPPAGHDMHTVESILTPDERTRHMQSFERGHITVPPHDEENEEHHHAHEHHFFDDAGSLQGADTPCHRLPPATTTSTTTTGSHPGTFSKSYVAGLWIALGLAMLALVAVTAFQVYSGLEKHDEERHSIQAASGAVLDSNNAVALVTKQQEHLHALDLSVTKLRADQAELSTTLQMQQTDFLTKLGEEQQARAISLCTSLLDTLQQVTPTTTAGHLHTEYVCQAQNGWQLTACPTTAVVVQALLGRFTSAADGPCTDRGNAAAWRLESCPQSADVTTAAQQALAQAKGGPVLDTPMQLLQAGGLRADPCPRAYKQLQVVYTCPVGGGMTKLDASARLARCEEMMQKEAAAAVPQK